MQILISKGVFLKMQVLDAHIIYLLHQLKNFNYTTNTNIFSYLYKLKTNYMYVQSEHIEQINKITTIQRDKDNFSHTCIKPQIARKSTAYK